MNGRELLSVNTGIRLAASHERRGAIDLYRLRLARGSPIRGEQVRLKLTFSADGNDSMTLNTAALQGQPLYLLDGKIPDNQFTKWGSLSLNARTGVVVGATLCRAKMSFIGRRGHSRSTGIATLSLITTSGSPNFGLTLFGYQPTDRRFWWAEWYQSRFAELPPESVSYFGDE